MFTSYSITATADAVYIPKKADIKANHERLPTTTIEQHKLTDMKNIYFKRIACNAKGYVRFGSLQK